MTESPEEKISRVQQMVDDKGQTWDLSPNDQAALAYVLGLAKKVQSCPEYDPENRQESIKAIRQHFQENKPTIEDLIATGEYQVMPLGEYLEQ